MSISSDNYVDLVRAGADQNLTINCDGCETIYSMGSVGMTTLIRVGTEWVIGGELFRPKEILVVNGEVLFDNKSAGGLNSNTLSIV